MRIAALYDIHGNLPAVQAVLQELDQAEVDEIVIGGDLFPGPMPVETLACLLDLGTPVRFIQGNGDREVLAAMRGLEPESALPPEAQEAVICVAQQLGHEYERVLAGWPLTLRLPLPQVGDALFCHATPHSDSQIFTRLTPDDRRRPLFEECNASLVVCRHTHMQFDRRVGELRVLNAGSVGMPFGEPGADWLLFTPQPTLRHTPYDLVKAAERIPRTSYPQAEMFASRSVLRPPSEAEMLSKFTSVEENAAS